MPETLFANLRFVPQVSLLVMPKDAFEQTIADFLKRIICLQQFCADEDLCHNCQKLKDNYYFDLMRYKFNQNNLMKKQDVTAIINTLSHQSLENNNPKVCVLEEIEYASLEAANVFLKFLENLPSNTFIIFVSSNVTRILPTIKSRSQIINLIDQKIQPLNHRKFAGNDFLIVQDLINAFISHDNSKKFSENFFLIKNIINLKENFKLFFQFLLLITEQKLKHSNNFNSNQEFKNSLENWKNNDQIFLINLVESITELINKFSNTKNLNLNLLLNHFFITIYQGPKNELWN